MRDLLTVLDRLVEGKYLTPSEILKRPGRFEKFTQHIANGLPFYTEEGDEVVIDPSQLDKIVADKNSNLFAGSYKLLDVNGQAWPIARFMKTNEFGGATAVPGAKDDEAAPEVSKEAALLKPSQIGIVDRNIAGKMLGQQIISNETLAGTDYGRVVIEMAKQIISGQPVIIPQEYLNNKQLKTSIVDYAGEYLGVLALVSGRSAFDGGPTKRSALINWLGSDFQSLVLNFPSKANTPLADSFATVTNSKTGHTLNISSKGTGGGAAPSMSGLKVPDSIRSNSEYDTVVRIIDLCSDKTLLKPTSVSQVFYAMNVLNESYSDKIPSKFRPFLPWRDQDINLVIENIKERGARPLSNNYQKLFADLRSKGSDGGKLTYVTKKVVMDIINSGSIPEFQDAILETLGMNFVQQYAEVDKSGQMQFITQWPAQLDGIVTIETKSGSTDPTKGGFSFKLRPIGTKPEELPEPTDADDVSQWDSKPAASTAKRQEKKLAKPGGRVSITHPGREREARKNDSPRKRR